ncbi:cell division protein FtsZ [Rhodobacteraceae bacterium NNCM2]|nr:cell division protein FtsZ [Coraliihabitans acroporae]
MALNFQEPEEHDLRARIAVFGVGGAGGNAVNNMIDKKLPGVEFIAANTDSQALKHSKADRTIQLGAGLTKGLGAGSKPEVGYTAAEESLEEIISHLDGCHMCFITAGMGGGTGTGAAPVVARAAREMGILTVGVVTKPFQFEGTRRMQLAEMGVDEMQKVVDTLIVIPNQNLFQVASEKTTFVEAFVMADDVLYQGVQGVTDLMVRPGMINLDFADVRSVMEEMGKAMMGTGEADGDTRAIDAAEKAIANPLLDEVSLKGAQGVLINITGGYDLTLFEMDEAANRIKDEVDKNALIKFGSTIDPEMEGKMRVSVVATGIDAEALQARPPSESAPRRKPVETDRELLDAVRNTRPAARPAPAPAEPEAAEAEAEPVVIEMPEPVEPEVRAEQEFEAKAATTPSPTDIQARADIVRKRAEEARKRQQAEDQAAERQVSHDDEPALFDIDSASIAAPVAEEPAPAPKPAAAAPAEEANVMRADPRPSLPPRPRRHENPFLPAGSQKTSAEESAPPHKSLFAIKDLIHRVAGGAQPDPRYTEVDRSPQSSQQDDEAEGDIPAFLRRQAN